MSGRRPSKVLRANLLLGPRARCHNQEPDKPVRDELIRILVLDHEPETLERIENALWIWPHKVANAQNVSEAFKMYRHFKPTALIVGTESTGRDTGNTIAILRKLLPQVPIVALGSSSDNEMPAMIFDQGADAFLPREDLHRPTLHDLLRRIQRAQEYGKALDFPRMPEMSLPWRESKLVGALICDISGLIIDANDCLAKSLEYSSANSLLGKYVWRDILETEADWLAWNNIAGDMTALLYQCTSVKAYNDQLLWMGLEVFAAPNSPNHLQAVFLDQTELALLAGRVSDG